MDPAALLPEGQDADVASSFLSGAAPGQGPLSDIGADLLGSLHVPSIQGEGQIKADADAIDFSDISDVSDEEPVAGAVSQQAPAGGPRPEHAAVEISAPPSGASGAAPAALVPGEVVAVATGAAQDDFMSLQTYLELADEQAALEQPQAAPAGELPAAMLPSADPDAAEAAEKPPAPPLLHSAGLVSMAHDEVAETIMRDTYGVVMPAAEQARVVMDIVSFSESLLPREWFPRPRLAARDPPDRRALLRAPDKPGLDLDANDLDRILGRPPAEVVVRPEGDVAEAAADVYEDGAVIESASQLEHTHLGDTEGEAEPAAHIAQEARGKELAAAAPAQPAEEPRFESEAGKGAAVAQDTRPWAVANEPLDETAAQGPDLEIAREWDVDELELQGDAALPLACYAAVPEWEADIVWGGGGGDSDSDASGVRGAGEKSPAAAVNALTHDAHGVPWDTDSTDDDAPERRARSATRPGAQSSRRPSSRMAAAKAAAKAAGVERDWDNSQPIDPTASTAPRSARKQSTVAGAASDPAAALDDADDWEAELQLESGAGPPEVTEHPQTSGESDETQADAAPLAGLRVHEGVPRCAVYLDSGLWAPGVDTSGTLAHYSRAVERHDAAAHAATRSDDADQGPEAVVPTVESAVADVAAAAGAGTGDAPAPAEAGAGATPTEAAAAPAQPPAPATDSEGTQTDADVADDGDDGADGGGEEAGAAEVPNAPAQAKPQRPMQPVVASFLEVIKHPVPALLQPRGGVLVAPAGPSAGGAKHKHTPQLNPNDPTLLLETLPTAGPASASLAQARATLLPPPPPPAMQAALAEAIVPGDPIAAEFARFNVSQDALYRRQRRGRVAGMASGASSLHSPIATNLSQLPLPSQLTRDMLLRPHHPLHAFVPTPVESSESSGVIRLLFRSLTGFSRQLDQLQQFSGEVTVRTLWSAVRDAFADDLAPDTEPQLALNRGDGTFELLSGAMDKVMTEVDMVGPFMDVLVMYPSIRLLSARLLHTTLPSQPAALQALYNTRKKLTATQWHFYAVEHMLPSAYFIGHPGMGATLQTFYRKRKESDSGHMALAAEAETGGAWKVGQVTALNADDPSPLRLGRIDKGQHALTFETGAAIAPAAGHDVGTLSLLLVRRPSGHLFLRRFTGTFLVGQQQPKIAVLAPASQACREVEDSRIVAWVNRLLRKKQNKLARGGEAGGAASRPSVSFREVAQKFAPPPQAHYAGVDINTTEGALAATLAARCGLTQNPRDQDEWLLQEGARIHTEDELCTMVGPDAVCALEAMRAGLVRLDAAGLRRHEELAKCPFDRVALVAQALPAGREWREAALAAVEVASGAPWTLTENFIACTKKDTQKMFLSISGLGDPSGTGLAISYLKNMKRMGKDPVNRLLGKPEAAAITGTGADLRKLHNKEAGRLLKEKFQVDQETIDNLNRWERIGVLRHLSTEAVAKGIAPEGLGHMFARNVKVNMEDMRKAQFEAATLVLRRQLAFLRTGAFPEASVHDAAMAPIGSVAERLDEQSLAICAMPYADARGQERDTEAPGPEVHGQLRLRRTIRYKAGRGGGPSRTIIYSNRDNIFALNSLCEKWDGNNDKLGIVVTDKDCPTARTMDGVHRQLTLWTRTGGETKRKFFKYKNRKVAVRARAPPARAAPAARASVRAPTAASKASLRRKARDDAGEAAPAAAAAAASAKASRPKADPAAAAAAKEARAKAAAKRREAKKRAEEEEQADTEEDDFLEEEVAAAEGAVEPGAAVPDEHDPEFVEYEGDFDESSNSGALEDDMSDSDYEEIAQPIDGSDDDDDAGGRLPGASAAGREARAAQRAGKGGGGGGGGGKAAAAAAGGGEPRRRAGAGTKRAVADSDVDATGQVLDLIDDGDIEEAGAAATEDEFSSALEEEDDSDEYSDGGKPARSGRGGGGGGRGSGRATSGAGRKRPRAVPAASGGGGGGASKGGRRKKRGFESSDDDFDLMDSESDGQIVMSGSDDSDEVRAPAKKRAKPPAAAKSVTARPKAPAAAAAAPHSPAATAAPQPTADPSAPSAGKPRLKLKLKRGPQAADAPPALARPAGSVQGSYGAAASEEGGVFSDGGGSDRESESDSDGEERVLQRMKASKSQRGSRFLASESQNVSASQHMQAPGSSAALAESAHTLGGAAVGRVPGAARALKDAGMKELRALFSSCISWAKKLNLASDTHALNAPFVKPPSRITLPDYYDLVDERDVVTWTHLRTRHYTSRAHFLSAILQLQQNAAVYNRGARVRNKAYVPGGSEPETIKRGPGKIAHPGVATLVDVFVERVYEYLNEADVATQARAAEYKVLAGYLLCLEEAQQGSLLWAECEQCKKWRLVDHELHRSLERGAQYVCDADARRPVRGCHVALLPASAEEHDDEVLMQSAVGLVSAG